jgi:hypothetical protein
MTKHQEAKEKQKVKSAGQQMSLKQPDHKK